MQVIALTGYPRAGKDTIPALLRELYPDSCIIALAFADKLKGLHMKELGITSRTLYDFLLHESIPFATIDLRVDIQRLSLELLTKDPNCIVNWVQAAIKTLPDNALVVITDLRYPAEYTYAVENEYPVIRVNRDKLPKPVSELSWNKHVATFETDFVIDNTKDLNALSDELMRMVTTLKLNVV